MFILPESSNPTSYHVEPVQSRIIRHFIVIFIILTIAGTINISMTIVYVNKMFNLLH